jgi:hypothetical protein
MIYVYRSGHFWAFSDGVVIWAWAGRLGDVNLADLRIDLAKARGRYEMDMAGLGYSGVLTVAKDLGRMKLVMRIV